MLNLDELVTQTYTQFKQEEANEKAARETAERAKKEQGVNEFKAALTAELGEDFVEALGITFKPMYNGKHTGVGCWTDTESDTVWMIQTYYDLSVRWKISAEAAQPPRTEVFNHTASSGNLRDAILVGLGKAREWAKERRAKEEARLKATAEAEAEIAAQAHAAEERRAVEAAAAALADAEIRAEIERIRQTTPPAWVWKDGATLTLYVMTWQCGASTDKNGEAAFDYDSAYTFADALDGGYITTINQRGEQRQIKLSMDAHRPTWDRLTIRSVAELPTALTIKQTVKLHGVYAEYSHETNRVARYAYTTRQSEYEEIAIGAIPVQWVRDLVDALI